MGFNISVCGDADDSYYEQNFFIDRSYYFFVANYEMFGEEALIIKAGDYYGLDLHPLVNIVFLEDLASEEQERATQDAGELLVLVETFAERLRQEPDMMDKVEFEYKFTRGEWETYVCAGQLLADLAEVSRALAYYQRIGRPAVFFGVG